MRWLHAKFLEIPISVGGGLTGWDNYCTFGAGGVLQSAIFRSRMADDIQLAWQ